MEEITKCLGHCPLQRGGGGEGQELVRARDHRDHGGGRAHPADLPARDAEDLAGGTDLDRAVGHAGEGAQGTMGLPVKPHLLPDLVADGDQIVRHAQRGQQGELGLARDRACRVQGIIEDQRPGARRDRGLDGGNIDAQGGAQVIGITGAPGVGKSTTVDALIKLLRERDFSVAVLAVDPSSPISGGALLGDRIRLTDHFTDSKVFIRSLATRGHLGGLSASTKAVLQITQSAKFDYIIVETVGVGQSEVEVMRVVDTVLVVLAPGMGDGIQASKAGLLEIGDIYLVNKSDREGAKQTAQDISRSIEMSPPKTVAGKPWIPPVLLGAMQNGSGVVELMAEIEKHRNG